MRLLKIVVTVAGLGLLLHLGASPASAEKEWRSPLTLGEPTEIPGTVLEPGKYLVRVLDVNEPRKVVQFMNAEETKVFATVMGVPNYRVTVTGEGQFIYFQRAAGRPQALKAWFYPVNNFGIEFVYPKVEAIEIAESSRQNVFAAETAQPAPEEKIVAVTPERKEMPIQEEPLADEPTQVAQAAPKTLPRTGSRLPVIGLAGLVALAAGLALRIARR
jgi:hypothetical protein